VAATAFTDAMSTALVVSAGVALLTAGLVLVFFPRTPAPVMGVNGPIEGEMYLDDEVTVPTVVDGPA